jgi:hypothetical protein
MEIGPKLKLGDLTKQTTKLDDGRHHHGDLLGVISDAEVAQTLDPVQFPNCDREGHRKNRELADLISDAVDATKRSDEHGPHFLLAWRLYPNQEHPRWQMKEPHSCGCSCGGLAPIKGKKKRKVKKGKKKTVKKAAKGKKKTTRKKK